MDVVKKLQHFISYWYTRYLLATELYMVEPWEKTVIRHFTKRKWKLWCHAFQELFRARISEPHISATPHRSYTSFPIAHTSPLVQVTTAYGNFNVLFALFFGLLWYFNYNFVVNSIGQLRSGSTPYTQEVC